MATPIRTIYCAQITAYDNPYGALLCKCPEVLVRDEWLTTWLAHLTTVFGMPVITVRVWTE